MKRLHFIIIIIISLLLFSACSTIEINETDVFDAHRTITPESFNYDVYSFEEIRLETGDGEELNGWAMLHNDARGTVLYLGGNGFLMVKSKPVIEAYSNIPVNLVMFDYRGYGMSSGSPTVEGIRMDADTAMDFVKNKPELNGGPLIVHGHSMGSFLSAYLADTREIAGYILESPVTDVDDWTRTLVPWLVRRFVRFDIDPAVRSESNINRVQNIELPLLVMGGNSDEITPFEMAEKLYRKSVSENKTIVEMNGGTHNDLPTFPEYVTSINEFLNSLPAGEEPTSTVE
jgi:uncharacterized protein